MKYGDPATGNARCWTSDAYRAFLAGKAAPVQNGLSGDQQFFLGFAQA